MDMDYTDPNVDYLGRTKKRGQPTPGYHKYYTDEEVWARLSYDNQTFHDDTSYTHVHDRNMISGIPKWTESNRPGSHSRSIDLPRDVPLDEYIPRHPPSKRSRPHQLPRKRSKQSKILLYPITAIILALTLTVVLLVIFLSRQGNATTKGTLNLELRLAGQFYNGMVDSTTSIFKSTENQLCSGAEEAMRSGSTFPYHTTIDCKVDSLRSGSIIATLQVNVTGSYAIPDNEHYVQAIESHSTLGSFTVIPGSVVVLSAIYTRDGVETRVTSTTTPTTSHISFLLSPSGHLRIDCNVENSPSDWNEIRMMSTDANVGVVATGYENGTIHSDNSTYELSLVAVDSNVSIGLVFPNTTNYSSIRSNYTCQMLRTGNIVAEATEYVTIPDMAINDSITAPGEAITISCNVRYPPSIWEQFNIVSVNSTVIHGRAYPNGTVVGGNSSYTVELQQNSENMTLSVIFPNTTTHCTARGSYLCMFSFTGSVIEQSSSVIISDHASGLILDGNNTVEEGERFWKTGEGGR
ncbi:uncharacterized protein [Argopecten irradians]|uniref:uncharacterized protein isoform X2 n=1 Tax=Argopecten irradians TaxID=31199 RepID=UPI003710EB74